MPLSCFRNYHLLKFRTKLIEGGGGKTTNLPPFDSYCYHNRHLFYIQMHRAEVGRPVLRTRLVGHTREVFGVGTVGREPPKRVANKMSN